MYSIHIIIYLLSSIFSLHLTIAINPLSHICSSSSTYISDSSYDNNLKTLFNQLSLNVPPTGFGQSSVGKNPDTVNGLALCRGEISKSDCKFCVDTAWNEIKNRCPTDRGGIVWYDMCLLRYSNLNFLGTIDSGNKACLYNAQNVSDAKSFNEKSMEFLSQLADKAYRSPKLYVSEQTSLGKLGRLYGLVQCTRDISNIQCKKCLDDAISEFPSCCNGRRGGRVLGGSCYFRYELSPIPL